VTSRVQETQGQREPLASTPTTIDEVHHLHPVKTLAINADSGLLLDGERWVSAYSTSIMWWVGDTPVEQQQLTAMFQLERSRDATQLITDTHTIDVETHVARPTLDLAHSELSTIDARLERVTASPELDVALVSFDAGLGVRSGPAAHWYLVDLKTGAVRQTLRASEERGPAPIVAWTDDFVAIGRFPVEHQVTWLARDGLTPVRTMDLPTYASIMVLDQSRTRLAVTDPSGILVIVRVADGLELARLDLDESIYHLAFHPTLDLVAVSGKSGVRLTSLGASPTILASTPEHADRLAFDEDGRLYASGRIIRVYELSREVRAPAPAPAPAPWRPPIEHLPAAQLTLNEGRVLPTSASASAGLLVGAGGEVFTAGGSNVIEWRLGVPVATHPVQRHLGLRLRPDGLLVGEINPAVEEDTAWIEAEFEGHPSLSVATAQVSPDGQHAVRTLDWRSRYSGTSEPSSAREWTLVARSGATLAQGSVTQWAPNVAWADTFVVISGPGDVRVHARSDGSLQATLPVRSASSLHTRADNIITIADDGVVTIWESQGGNPRTWAPRVAGSVGADVRAYAFHPSQPLLAVAERRAVLIYHYGASLSLVAKVSTDGVDAIAFAPGDTLWVSEEQRQARMPRVREFHMTPK